MYDIKIIKFYGIFICRFFSILFILFGWLRIYIYIYCASESKALVIDFNGEHKYIQV